MSGPFHFLPFISFVIRERREGMKGVGLILEGGGVLIPLPGELRKLSCSRVIAVARIEAELGFALRGRSFGVKVVEEFCGLRSLEEGGEEPGFVIMWVARIKIVGLGEVACTWLSCNVKIHKQYNNLIIV